MKEILLITILTLIAVFIVFKCVFAMDMVFTGYSETSDCLDKSERIEVVNKETGVVSYVVKSPCEK